MLAKRAENGSEQPSPAVEALSGTALDDLLGVVCSVDWTVTDFAHELDCSLFEAQRRIDVLPFVDVDERGVIVVPPPLIETVRAERSAELLARARQLAAGRAPEQAISTLLRGGDLIGAARAAERSIELLPALDTGSLALLGDLPQSVLRSFPRLWLRVGMPRWWHDDPDEMVEHALIALKAAGPNDIETRFGLVLMVFPVLIGKGQRARAAALRDEFLRAARASKAAPHHALLALFFEALWKTFDESDFDLADVERNCTPLFVSPALHLVYLLMPCWTWNRIHGRLAEAVETAERAVEAARELMPGSYVDALEGAIYTAWWAGDDDRFATFVALHAQAVERGAFQRVHGFMALAAAGGEAPDAARDRARPFDLTEALLIRASHRRDADDARRDLLEVVAIAERLRTWEIALTARVALAAFDDDAQAEHLREARRLAERVGTRELIAAAEELTVTKGRAARHYRPIVGRFARLRPPTARLSFVDRTLTLGERSAKLSPQQLAIVAALAFATAPIRRRDLSVAISHHDAMLPERVLEVQLARLRRAFGPDIIVHDGVGYRPGVRVTTDWHEAREPLASRRGTGDAQPDALTIAEAMRRMVNAFPALASISTELGVLSDPRNH